MPSFFHVDRGTGRFEDASGSFSSSLRKYLRHKISYVYSWSHLKEVEISSLILVLELEGHLHSTPALQPGMTPGAHGIGGLESPSDYSHVLQKGRESYLIGIRNSEQPSRSSTLNYLNPGAGSGTCTMTVYKGPHTP